MSHPVSCPSLGGGAAADGRCKKIRRYRLITIDEVGYIPFDHDTANLFFQLVASRYEQGSVMGAGNLPFGRWRQALPNDVVAAAMIDRLVHRAEVLTLTGDFCRTRQRIAIAVRDVSVARYRRIVGYRGPSAEPSVDGVGRGNPRRAGIARVCQRS